MKSQSQREIEEVTENGLSFTWITPPSGSMTRAGPGQARTWSSIQVSHIDGGTQVVGASSAALPDRLVGNWISSGTANTVTGAHVGF